MRILIDFISYEMTLQTIQSVCLCLTFACVSKREVAGYKQYKSTGYKSEYKVQVNFSDVC